MLIRLTILGMLLAAFPGGKSFANNQESAVNGISGTPVSSLQQLKPPPTAKIDPAEAARKREEVHRSVTGSSAAERASKAMTPPKVNRDPATSEKMLSRIQESHTARAANFKKSLLQQ